MSADFYDYVRGRSDVVPPGHDEAGLRVYRHLVWLGASQAVEAAFPPLRPAMGEVAWAALIAAFVRDSRWTSPHYADVGPAFLAFLDHARDGLPVPVSVPPKESLP